jgi:hypothetical protein
MYIDVVPNRNSPPAILLRESYRDGNKVRKRTLLNLTDWPGDLVAGFRALLKGGTVIPAGQEALTITRSLPHGHVAAVLGTLRRIGLDRLLGPDGNRCRDLAIALIASRVIAPASKLATSKALDPATAASSLGEVLDLGPVDEDELYTALDWLLARQPAIETALAKRPLEGGTLVLYDVSSSYLAAASWPGAAITATARRASCRSSMVCSAPPTAARWRSRCSTAIPPIRPRSPARSASSNSGSECPTWCWSATAG